MSTSCCSHGFAEYFCPSYDGIAEALVQSGYLVFGHDHIGHGRSTGQRVQLKSMDDYVQPLLAHVKKVQNDYNKEVPLSIIGFFSDENFYRKRIFIGRENDKN